MLQNSFFPFHQKISNLSLSLSLLHNLYLEVKGLLHQDVITPAPAPERFRVFIPIYVRSQKRMVFRQSLTLRLSVLFTRTVCTFHVNANIVLLSLCLPLSHPKEVNCASFSRCGSGCASVFVSYLLKNGLFVVS